MTKIEELHSSMVTKLHKSGEAILYDMDYHTAELLYCAVGLSCESAEVLDTVKKHAFNTKELDEANLIEELGDLEYHMERMRQLLRVSREEILQNNLDKLEKRFPKGYYTNQQAVTRADKS